MKNRIMPCLAYRDAHTMMKWLIEAFGFEQNALFETEDGKVAHAEISYKGNILMLGTADSGTPFSKLIMQPREAGGLETQSPYILVDEDEIDDHYARALKHGARMVVELQEESYGGKNYMCYDPEGHLWSFGSYDPWHP